MGKWQSENGVDVIAKAFVFIISPFLSFIVSIKSIKTRSSFFIFYLFAFFYGMGFITESGKSETARNDGAVFRALFEEYICKLSFRDFQNEIIDILEGRSWHKDIYFHCVSYFVSTFTDNYHFLFLALAAIFGYFMLRSLMLMVKEDNFKVNIVCLLLVLLFVNNGIFNINGMRFWTATWIATYALLRVVIEKRKIYIALFAITPLVHSSFYFFFIIFLLYLFLKVKETKMMKMYYFSFFFSSISVFIISAFIGNISYLSRFMVYLDPEAVFNMYEEQSIAKAVFDVLGIIYINCMFYLIYKSREQIPLKFKRLFDFCLIFITVVNIIRPIPSLGSRYFMILFPFLAYLWLVTYGSYQRRMFIYFLPIAMLWYVHNSYIMFVMFLEPMFYWTNPVSLILRYLY